VEIDDLTKAGLKKLLGPLEKEVKKLQRNIKKSVTNKAELSVKFEYSRIEVNGVVLDFDLRVDSPKAGDVYQPLLFGDFDVATRAGLQYVKLNEFLRRHAVTKTRSFGIALTWGSYTLFGSKVKTSFKEMTREDVLNKRWNIAYESKLEGTEEGFGDKSLPVIIFLASTDGWVAQPHARDFQ